MFSKKNKKNAVAFGIVSILSTFAFFVFNYELQAAPVTSTFQKGASGYVGVTDSYINRFNVATNYGSDSSMIVRQIGEMKSLIKFDLSSIPAGSQINSATLELYLYDPQTAGTGTLNVHRILPGRNWSENQVSWNLMSSGNSWSAPGLVSSIDYETVATASWSVPPTDTAGWKSFNLTSVVQQWVNGTENNGLVLIIPNTPYRKYFYTSNYSNVALRPKLTVTYDDSGQPPLDTLPPVLSAGSPVGVLPSGTVNAALSLATNENSVCRYSTVAGTAFGSMTDTFGVTGALAHNTPLSGLADGGSYAYYVRCQDEAGNANSADYPVSFSVASPPDTIAPSVSLTEPLANAVVSGTSVNVSASASDNVGVAGVQFFLDGNLLQTEDAVSPYSITWNTLQVANGQHTLTALVRDLAGNTTLSAAVPVVVNNQTVTVAFQQGLSGYTGATDTYIDRFAQGANNGSNSTLVLRFGGERKVLLKFDLSAIPQGADISSAILDFNLADATYTGAGRYSFHRILPGRAWAPSEANWTRYRVGGNWTAAGMQAGTDYEVAASATLAFPYSDTVGIKSADITSLVQQWVNGVENNGLAIIIDLSRKSLSSSEAVSLALRPKLTVTYDPDGQPEDPPADTVAPSVPAGLNGSALSASRTQLSWLSATDNVGVAGYKLLRDGSQIATTTGISFTDTGLAASTTYAYSVSAYDAAGNTSSASAPFSIATLPLVIPTSTGAIIADHRAVRDFNYIPSQWLEAAKQLAIHYGHQSHGAQIMEGGEALEQAYPNYNLIVGHYVLPQQENPAGIRMMEYGAETFDYWSTEAGLAGTRSAASTGLYNFSMFSWCGEQNDNSTTTVEQYLDALNSLEMEFPSMRFIYMTGHLEWSPDPLERNNQMVRDYALANGKVLFDFADIESFDPAGNYYPNAHESCDWCASWIAAHPEDAVGLTSSCSHSHPFNCKNKTKAFWWMMARLAGWDGVTGQATDNEAPEIPNGLQAQMDPTGTAINLSWQTAADNVRTAGYKVYRNGVLAGSTNQNSVQDPGRAPQTAYTYSVSAFDSEGNISAISQPVSITTP